MTDRRLTATIAGPPLVASRRDRTLSGAVLPWDAIGYTSVGPTRFARGSVQVPENAGVVLNLEHDQTRPIGYATQLVDGPDALSGTFRLSDTTAGRDALTEAVDGLRTGFSVEVDLDEWEYAEDGCLLVTASHLIAVAHVTRPAFDSARVTP